MVSARNKQRLRSLVKRTGELAAAAGKRVTASFEWITLGGAILGAVGLLLEIALDGARFVLEGREL